MLPLRCGYMFKQHMVSASMAKNNSQIALYELKVLGIILRQNQYPKPKSNKVGGSIAKNIDWAK